MSHPPPSSQYDNLDYILKALFCPIDMTRPGKYAGQRRMRFSIDATSTPRTNSGLSTISFGQIPPSSTKTARPVLLLTENGLSRSKHAPSVVQMGGTLSSGTPIRLSPLLPTSSSAPLPVDRVILLNTPKDHIPLAPCITSIPVFNLDNIGIRIPLPVDEVILLATPTDLLPSPPLSTSVDHLDIETTNKPIMCLPSTPHTSATAVQATETAAPSSSAIDLPVSMTASPASDIEPSPSPTASSAADIDTEPSSSPPSPIHVDKIPHGEIFDKASSTFGDAFVSQPANSLSRAMPAKEVIASPVLLNTSILETSKKMMEIEQAQVLADNTSMSPTYPSSSTIDGIKASGGPLSSDLKVSNRSSPTTLKATAPMFFMSQFRAPQLSLPEPLTPNIIHNTGSSSYGFPAHWESTTPEVSFQVQPGSANISQQAGLNSDVISDPIQPYSISAQQQSYTSHHPILWHQDVHPASPVQFRPLYAIQPWTTGRTGMSTLPWQSHLHGTAWQKLQPLVPNGNWTRPKYDSLRQQVEQLAQIQGAQIGCNQAGLFLYHPHSKTPHEPFVLHSWQHALQVLRSYQFVRMQPIALQVPTDGDRCSRDVPQGSPRVDEPLLPVLVSSVCEAVDDVEPEGIEMTRDDLINGKQESNDVATSYNDDHSIVDDDDFDSLYDVSERDYNADADCESSYAVVATPVEGGSDIYQDSDHDLAILPPSSPSFHFDAFRCSSDDDTDSDSEAGDDASESAWSYSTDDTELTISSSEECGDLDKILHKFGKTDDPWLTQVEELEDVESPREGLFMVHTPTRPTMPTHFFERLPTSAKRSGLTSQYRSRPNTLHTAKYTGPGLSRRPYSGPPLRDVTDTPEYIRLARYNGRDLDEDWIAPEATNIGSSTKPSTARSAIDIEIARNHAPVASPVRPAKPPPKRWKYSELAVAKDRPSNDRSAVKPLLFTAGIALTATAAVSFASTWLGFH